MPQLFNRHQLRVDWNAMPQLILTATGPDRPGIVGELTAHLHSAGCNILDSRMVNLRGEFAMIILFDSPAGKPLEQDLPKVGEQMGLRISLTPQHAPAARVTGQSFRLKTYSTDQPGIVARVTNVLRTHGVNIEELEAKQQSAPFAGEPLFLTEMLLTIPSSVDLGKLRQDLSQTAHAINCDLDLDPA